MMIMNHDHDDDDDGDDDDDDDDGDAADDDLSNHHNNDINVNQCAPLWNSNVRNAATYYRSMQPCIDESCPRKPFPNEVNRASFLACTEARHKAEALGTRGHLPKPFVRVLRVFRVLVPSPQGRGLSQGLALWKETPKDGKHMDWKDFPETLFNTPGTPRKLHGHATTDTVSSSPLPLGAMQHEGCRGFGTQPLLFLSVVPIDSGCRCTEASRLHEF